MRTKLHRGFFSHHSHLCEKIHWYQRRTRRKSTNTKIVSQQQQQQQRAKVQWLDLRGSGLCMIERLSLEENLLRHTNDNWVIVGTHDVWPPKYLRTLEKNDSTLSSSSSSSSKTLPKYIIDNNNHNNNKTSDLRLPDIDLNTDCMIVMGIGGKPGRLLKIDNVIRDKVLVVKRFSGGGTVVMDHQSVWTTLIGRTLDFPTVDPFPRSIMEFSANAVFGPAFEIMTNTATTCRASKGSRNDHHLRRKTLVVDCRSCSATENLRRVLTLPSADDSVERKRSNDYEEEIPKFALRENDYVLGDQNKKIGGNAQSIIKGGWLHHTSFLWNYHESNMESYLLLPDKRPEYRQSRSHRDFLVPLSKYFGNSYSPFVRSIKQACKESFDLEESNLPTVMQDLIDPRLGGMEAWFAENRTKIVHDLS